MFEVYGVLRKVAGLVSGFGVSDQSGASCQDSSRWLANFNALTCCCGERTSVERTSGVARRHQMQPTETCGKLSARANGQAKLERLRFSAPPLA